MLIGILSDTHGLLRQEVSFALLEISGPGDDFIKCFANMYYN